MAQGETDVERECARPAWSARSWVRGVMVGVWIGLCLGAVAGSRLAGLDAVEHAHWDVLGMLIVAAVVSVITHLLAPTKDEIAARAAWFRGAFGEGTRRVLRNVGLVLMCAALAGLVVSFMLLSTRAFAVVAVSLVLSLALLLPAAMAGPPKEGEPEAASTGGADSSESGK